MDTHSIFIRTNKKNEKFINTKSVMRMAWYEMIGDKQGMRTEIFEQTTKRMAEVYRAKNKDYGNSFQKVRDKFPTAILVRLNDKMHRLESIMGSGEIEVRDESIDDTLLDLANYCVLELVERYMDREKECSNAKVDSRLYADSEDPVEALANEPLSVRVLGMIKHHYTEEWGMGYCPNCGSHDCFHIARLAPGINECSCGVKFILHCTMEDGLSIYYKPEDC